MKVLRDTCVSAGVRKALAEAEYDVVWVGDWPKDPGDEEILAHARQESRNLVTLDKDFGELAIVRRLAHCGIVRLVALSTSQQVNVCLSVLAAYGLQLEAGAIVTAESSRIRVDLPATKNRHGNRGQGRIARADRRRRSPSRGTRRDTGRNSQTAGGSAVRARDVCRRVP